MAEHVPPRRDRPEEDLIESVVDAARPNRAGKLRETKRPQKPLRPGQHANKPAASACKGPPAGHHVEMGIGGDVCALVPLVHAACGKPRR
jgi:hypothetical protein